MSQCLSSSQVRDNLGQHCVAEMSECFSSSYICRWCKASYKEVCEKSNCFEGCGDYRPEKISREWYDTQVQLVEEGGTSSFGIKGRCVFNKLKSFHCVGQQPPCLGHDLFEGIYDMYNNNKHCLHREVIKVIALFIFIVVYRI